MARGLPPGRRHEEFDMTGLTPEPLEIKGELKMPGVQTRHPGVATFVAGVVLAVGLLSGLMTPKP